MSDLISKKALLEALKGVEVYWYLDGNYTTYDETTIMDIIKQQPTVEAVPKSYAEQIRWERDVAVRQLNEIGCQFGQKMDEVKDKLNSAKNWIPCSERLPAQPGNNPVFESKPLELYLISVKNADYPFRAFWNGKFFTDGFSKVENVIAWTPLPEPYKGETENDES